MNARPHRVNFVMRLCLPNGLQLLREAGDRRILCPQFLQRQFVFVLKIGQLLIRDASLLRFGYHRHAEGVDRSFLRRPVRNQP